MIINYIIAILFRDILCFTVIFWIDPLYIEEERSSAKIVVHRNGYLGNSDNTVGKKMNSLLLLLF